ncbi:MAG: hypothetical protein ABIQ95_12275 [Bdellovibrionia bacterium]
MSRTAKFSLIWVLGIFQAFITLGYATEGTRSPENFSANPIRISRNFFRSPLFGKISIVSNNVELSTSSISPILWIEYPPSAPAPEQGALADFRDHLGCAYLSGTEGFAVCFNMMGDVSSLGINSREMKVFGIEDYFKSTYQIFSTQHKCQPDVQNIRFEGATGSEGKIDLSFVADTLTQAGCKNYDDVLKIQFQMSAF